MEFLTSAILGGIFYDVVKEGVKLTGGYVKKMLKNWILDDKDCETLARTINEAPEALKKTEKFMEAYLDDNADVKEILSRTSPVNQYMQSNNTFDQSPNQQGNNNRMYINYQGEHTPPKKA